MSTRLDRLFLLLETGSTPLIRRSAAQQLGEVQKLHPYELHNLLTKVHIYLRNSNWDTRIAAGQAVEAITKNVPQWEPRGAPKQEVDSTSSAQTAGRLLFSQFDVNKVLTCGASLLGSEGGEYDYQEPALVSTDKDCLARQRQMLNKRLGLDMAGALGLKTEDIFTDDDLVYKNTLNPHHIPDKKPVSELVHQQLRGVVSGMSARELNRAKRKAKLFAKQVSKDGPSDSTESSEPPVKKTRCATPLSEDSMDSKLSNESNGRTDHTFNLDEAEDWPFEGFCELLINDLFNSAWEVRHGAATGLREIIKLHGRGAGKSVDTPSNQMNIVNQIWLCDVVLRLLCVLALDKFGDYVSDEVVAPVRETCAQTLGVVVKFLDKEGVQGVVVALLQLLAQNQWEVRHGGLLGFKYLLAVRQDLTSTLLPVVLQPIFQGLQDEDDDVRAVAAAALVPVCNTLVQVLPHQISVIITCLWETLLDLDDLTASTNSIMTLLSTLLSHPTYKIQSSSSASLSEYVPRLWPFLRHNIASVRKAALETFHSVLHSYHQQNIPCDWLIPMLPDALRHIHQRSLLETREDILNSVVKVWDCLLMTAPLSYLIAAANPWLGVFFCLSMQPPNLPFDPNYLIEAKHRGKEQPMGRGRQVVEQQPPAKITREHIGGVNVMSCSAAEKDKCITKARLISTRLVGRLCQYITKTVPNYPPDAEKPVETIGKLLMFHLNSKSALQRLVAALVIYEWGSSDSDKIILENNVKTRLVECLSDALYFDEIAMSFTRMQSACRDFIAGLKQQDIDMDAFIPPGILTFEQAMSLTSTVFMNIKGSLKPRSLQTFEDRQKQLQITISQTHLEQQTLSIRVLSCLAMAATVTDCFPEKLNPVVRPLMDSIKKEENSNIQNRSGLCLAELLKKCLARTPNPAPKIVKNLCTFLCCDPTVTPCVMTPCTSKQAENLSEDVQCDAQNGILTLTSLHKATEKSKRWQRRAGKDIDISGDLLTQEDVEAQKQLLVQRQGADAALSTVTKFFGERLPDDLPFFWESVFNPFKTLEKVEGAENDSESNSQELVNSLQVLEVIGPNTHSNLKCQVLSKLPVLCKCLCHKYTAVRHMAARAFGMLSQALTSDTMLYVIESVLPMLGASEDDAKRQGASEALHHIVDQLGMDLIPYIVLLVVPVLGRMSDQNNATRLIATQCFATMIRLMPLEAGIQHPPEMKTDLIEKKLQERQFLEQLLDGSKLESYDISIPVSAELRKYQKDGVNWLAFLNKYKLHGILCDDMGLGKTLQSICILASDHFNRKKNFKASQNPDCSPLPSLVVCPPTLTGHWGYEIKKFVEAEFLNPLIYAGPPAERIRLQRKVKKHNLVVASYDVVRNDIDFFSSITWNYCILDEGHIIKNGKTKLSKAVKQLNCNHRLILSGTPIQNNVLDLWSLFDFLMPGFLGTEKQFQARYGKPILQSRDAKSSSKEQESGALAMESLHRQVLPFVLRRMKEDVLQDLPPKIIQDYYCDLSPLQMQLYEDFEKSSAGKGVNDCVIKSEEKAPSQGVTHVFQALQYLRKVCNHPALVLNQSHPKYEEIKSQLQKQNTNIKDIQHAPKLTALKQLLNDCNIGVSDSLICGSSSSVDTEIPVVNQHRVLLFCQLKSMLDIVENNLLKVHMPSVTYLRLDGSIPAGSRHDIVHRFNNDPSIDILLLTTHVGGLGLNLTGADTVIFVEHDWNPMKDLQAMDRAHRIGQKKVVNVYRLITRGTLEEKIMGLQKFKLSIANTVISEANSSLQTMGTDQLLDLFTLDEAKKGQNVAGSSTANESHKKETTKSIIENLGELWDEKQYETEYDLGSFMKSLNK